MSPRIEAQRFSNLGYQIKRRCIARSCTFLAFCLVMLTSLMCTPLMAAEQKSDENYSVPLHRHRVAIFPFTEQATVAADPAGSIVPLPIAGGILIPPLIHVFAPGPIDLGFQGIDIEPNVIANFRGFSALAYPAGVGTARDSNGNTYDLETDMRVFQGEYISVDGTHQRGTFVFI